MEDYLMAKNITTVTLVGYIGEFPRERGNCFSVSVEGEERDIRIVNFNYENLKKLLDDGIVEFPIKISKISSGTGVIIDGRIPDDWYSKGFCETCTPRDLLPLPQRIKHLLDIQRGRRVETEVELDGKKMTMVSINVEPKTRKIVDND